MSDPSRGRLIRAVRLLPGAVRISRGVMEDIGGAIGEDASASPAKAPGEESALVVAAAEIRKLKSELRTRESELAESRASAQNLRSQSDAMRADLEREKSVFFDKALAEAAKQREEAAKTGFAEGSAKGYEDGLTRAEAKLSEEYHKRFADALRLLAEMGESLSKSRAALAAAHAPQLIRLWEMMLRKMLRVSVELDPAVTERAVSYILSRVSDRERIVIYLNPEDIEAIVDVKERLKDTIRGVKIFELLSDEHVDKGSCLVETSLGIYDARWRTQLEQISADVGDLLMEAMSSNGAAE